MARQERGDYIKRFMLYMLCIVSCFFICKSSHAKKMKVYAKDNVNIRIGANKKSKSIGLLYYGQAIKRIKKLKNGWSKVLYKNQIRFIKSRYLVKTKPKEKLGKYKNYSVPSGHHPKSYMDWKMTTDRTSPQYKFLQKCYISKNGILKYKYRYCVALGSYYCKKIGTKFDLILNNGKIIKCILAEQKADKDTDNTNRYHKYDKSVAEFIVSTSDLNRKTKLHGDCSYSGKDWNSEIKYIKVYKGGK